MLLPTTIVGSYPQPEWLIDRAKLSGRFPPRVRAQELWRIPPEFLHEAQEDATLMKHLPREVADGKMKAMVDGARLVRDEIKETRGSS